MKKKGNNIPSLKSSLRCELVWLLLCMVGSGFIHYATSSRRDHHANTRDRLSEPLWLGQSRRARWMHTNPNSILRSKMASMVSSAFELCLSGKRHFSHATVTTHTSALVFQSFITSFQDPCVFFLQLSQIVQSNICLPIFIPFILSVIVVYQDSDLPLCSVFSICSIPLSLPFSSFYVFLLSILECQFNSHELLTTLLWISFSEVAYGVTACIVNSNAWEFVYI